MDSQQIRDLLKRYLKGDTSSQEKASVNKWYSSFEETNADDDEAKEKVWGRVEAAIGKKQYFLSGWMRLAAAVLLLVTAGVSGWLAFKDSFQVEETFATYRTSPGEQHTFTLADGSTILLNSNSHVRVSDDFTEERRVELVDGEVFFDVKRDTERPFRISHNKLETEVLGTSFNIRGYSRFDDVTVSVISGRVRVSKGNTIRYELTKGQQFVFDKIDSSTTLTTIDANDLAWREGNIVLEDASFAQMVIILENYYGVVITTGDTEVLDTHYTATLKTTMKPLDALTVLAAVHNFNVTAKSDTLMIHK